MSENVKMKKGFGWKKTVLTVVVAIIAVVIIAVLFVIPAYISSKAGNQLILSKINASAPGKVNFADLSMGWWKGITIDDLKYNDEKAGTNVQAKQITVQPHYLPLLAGKVSIGRTVIDQPKVDIKLPAMTKEQPAVQAEPAVKKQGTGQLPIESIDLIVKDGDVSISGEKGQSVKLSNINSRINLQPPGSQSSFDMKMVVQDSGKPSNVSAAGTVTPSAQKGWTLEGMNGQVDAEVNKFDLGTLTPLLAMAKVDMQAKGELSANLQAHLNQGNLEMMEGTVTGSNIDIGGAALKGDRIKTSKLDVVMKLASEKDLMNIQAFKVTADWMNADITGTLPTSSDAMKAFFQPDTPYSLKGKFAVNVGQILSQMPNTTGAGKGTAITSGQLDGNIDTVKETGQKKLVAQAELTGLAGTANGQKISMSEPVKADAEIVSDKQGIKFNKIELTSAFAQVNCAGTTEQLDYKAGVDLGKLQSQLGQLVNIGPYTMAGTVNVNGRLASAKNKTSITGTAGAQDLSFTSKQGVKASEPKADANYAVVIDKDKNAIGIDQFSLTSTIAQVSTKNATVPMGTAGKLNMPLSAQVNFAKLQPFLILFAGVPKDLQLEGQAQSQLAVSGENNVYKIATDNTHIKGLKIVYPQQPPFTQDNIDIVFDVAVDTGQKTINVSTFQVTSPLINIKANLQQTSKAGQTNLSGKADLNYDWAALSSLAAPFVPGLQITGKRNDSISFAGSYPTGQTAKLMETLDTKAQVGFDTAKYKGIALGKTNVNIQMQKGLLNIEPFTTTANGGQLNFGGSADFNKKPTMFRTPGQMQIIKGVQINDIMSEAILKNVNPIFSGAANVSGSANFDCKNLAVPISGGSTADMAMTGTISIDDLQLKSGLMSQLLTLISLGSAQALKIYPTTFVLEKGVLSYDNMQMDVAGRPLNFAGSISLVEKTMNMKVTTPPIGGNRVVLPLEGTLDHPKVNAAGVLKENLQQQLMKQFQKGQGQQQPGQQQGTTPEQQLQKGFEQLFKKK